jgi:hypothetical protein
VRLQTAKANLAALMAGVAAATMALDPAMAAPPVIGTVTAAGAFRVDNSGVAGNATLFEGSLVETAGALSTTSLQSGARVLLGSMSKGRFFGDRMILEKGAGQLDKAENFRVEARGLTIQPETGNASARVTLGNGTRVEVAAFTGSFRVLNDRGVLVANLASGRAMEFEPQPSNTPSKLTGCLVVRGVHYLLTDETTSVVVELGGPGLEKEKGNRVEVTGAMDPTATPVSDASEFIRIASVKRLGKGCPAGSGAAAAAGAGGSAAKTGGNPPGHTGLSTTTLVAIIGGVAAAAVVGGLAATGKLTGSATTTTISQ